MGNSHMVSYGFDHADSSPSSPTSTESRPRSAIPLIASPTRSCSAPSGDAVSTTYDESNVPTAITLKNGGTTFQSSHTRCASGNYPVGNRHPSSSQTPPSTPMTPRGELLHGFWQRSSPELLLRPLGQPHDDLRLGRAPTMTTWRTYFLHPVEECTTNYTRRMPTGNVKPPRGQTRHCCGTWATALVYDCLQ